MGSRFPLVITGGYAVQAHRLVDRFSRDIDVATDSVAAMGAIVTVVVDGLTITEREILGRRHAWDDDFTLADLEDEED